MPAIRLGRMHLHWCDTCDLPVLNSKSCSRCKTTPRYVTHTPPGDIRPAFDHNIDLIKKTIDSQYGPGCSDLFMPVNNQVILNHAPDIDRLDEVIFHGKVQGALKFDLINNIFRFLPRISGANRFLQKVKQNYIVVDDGALKPICTGSNVLAPGIVKVSKDILVGDEILVLSLNKILIGVGTAYLSSQQMLEQNHGLAVKVRWHEEFDNINYPIVGLKENSVKVSASVQTKPVYKNKAWKLTQEANRTTMDKLIEKAKIFIHSTINKYELPVAVSFSGGKDSLAVLLLVLDSDVEPDLFFIDTGLEFPETIDHVDQISKKYKLRLITGKPTKPFWNGIEYFGPPGKDYRWCCKTSKLGPSTQLIKTHYPDGVLAFIGQRRYESEQRASKKMIWHNPWVPGQVGASPIQHWSALHIWLYLFSKGIEFNRLYENGLERIGCWLCPASDMADFKTVSEKHPDHEKWLEHLKRYAQTHSFTDHWIDYGLWRWKKLPKGVKQLLQDKGIHIKKHLDLEKGSIIPVDSATSNSANLGKLSSSANSTRDQAGGLQLYLNEGYTDCKYGLSQEGVFNKELDMARVVNLSNIIGEPMFDKSNGYCALKDGTIDIFPEGGIVIKGKNKQEIQRKSKKVHAIILRAMECIGCGICIGRCKNNALQLDEENGAWVVSVKPEHCDHCSGCLGPCPVINFNADQSYDN